MDAKELRLGNLINIGGNTIDSYQTYKPHIVTLNIIEAIQDENKERPDAILSIWQPIPLTEEWLLKFGFEKFKDCFTKKDIVLGKLTDAEFSFEGDYYACVTFKIPQYVHQLQNLYFCLTGEELTLKNE